jgi:hypothetical protein
VTIDTEPGHVEPEPGEPEQPNNPSKKWKIFIGGLFGAFALLAAYDLISSGVGPSGDASASGKSLSAATHSAVAAPAAPAPTPSRPDASATPAAGPPPHALAVTAIGAFGPDGLSDGDNPDDAYLAVADGADPWHSSWYRSSEFGNLQAGTGLLLYLGKSVSVSSVRLILGTEVGADVQVRVGGTPDLARLSVVASATDVGGTVQLPTARAKGAFVLIWFTALPPVGQGKYQVNVYDATVDGTAGS